MTIRTRLIIAMVLALLLAAGGITSALVTRGNVSRSSLRNSLARHVVSDLLALNILRADYQLNRSEQTRVQWEKQQKGLSALLDRVRTLYPKNDQVVARLWAANAQRLNLFEELVANFHAMSAGAVSPTGGSDAETTIVGKLLVLAQSTKDESDALAAQSQAELTNAQNLSAILTIVFIALLGLVVLLMTLLVSRTVLYPLRELEQGADAVAGGDLDYRIDIERDDEMGRAADAFDDMTASLAVSTEELERHRDSLEELVENRTEELQRANDELDAYAHAVSHDLRTPLAAATLANAMLKDVAQEGDVDALRQEVTENAASIERNLARAHELVTGLLKVAEAGQKPVKVTAVQISGLVSELLEERKASTAAAGVTLEIDDDLGTILADRTQIYQVFANLINNSIRHNDSPEPVTLVSYLGEEGGFHRYKVCDNGSGIPDEDLGKLFRPFFRGSRTSDTGIGLSIVDKIVRAYGGWIKVYNDNGVCFEFAIPDWNND